MTLYVLGIVLFALAILISVALHECGHMWVARATGMKVRRYFVGFGPTLWSTKRPNELGYTEYGVKAIPLGGFCDIAGMTPHDELAPEDEKYAMYRQKPWKRVAVLLAGPGMNFVVGLLVIYGVANVWGLPDLNTPTTAVVGETICVAPQVSQDEMGTCTGSGPAALAGIRPGDTVLKVGDTEVKTFPDMVDAVRDAAGPTSLLVERTENGQTSQFTTTVDVTPVQRFVRADGADEATPASVGAIGIAGVEPPEWAQYNPLSAVPATFTFTGDVAVKLGQALVKIPTKIGALVQSLSGGERDPETPISVVGASRLGGETVEHGVWFLFWLILAQLNFVLGVVNLLPLLPFDGGHIAVATYEKLRNMVRKARGLVAVGPVDYLKLMVPTYVVIGVIGVFTLLTVTADVINPITIF